jgi:hypothetical protein
MRDRVHRLDLRCLRISRSVYHVFLDSDRNVRLESNFDMMRVPVAWRLTSSPLHIVSEEVNKERVRTHIAVF